MKSLIAGLIALLGVSGGCAAPAHPVRTEAEAIAVARSKLRGDQGSLTVRRTGPRWVVATPLKPYQSGTTHSEVIIDAATGAAEVAVFQTAVTNEDL